VFNANILTLLTSRKIVNTAGYAKMDG